MGWDDYNYGYTSQRDSVAEVNRIIEKYRGSFYMLKKEEAEELQAALDKKAEIQRKCVHCYDVQPMFNLVWQVCRYCDWVNREYEHFKKD